MKISVRYIFFGRLYYFPLWLIYTVVGLTINSFSTHGINGQLENFPQSESTLVATVGIIIALLGVLGFSDFLVRILFGWFDAIVSLLKR